LYPFLKVKEVKEVIKRVKSYLKEVENED